MLKEKLWITNSGSIAQISIVEGQVLDASFENLRAGMSNFIVVCKCCHPTKAVVLAAVLCSSHQLLQILFEP